SWSTTMGIRSGRPSAWCACNDSVMTSDESSSLLRSAGSTDSLLLRFQLPILRVRPALHLEGQLRLPMVALRQRLAGDLDEGRVRSHMLLPLADHDRRRDLHALLAGRRFDLVAAVLDRGRDRRAFPFGRREDDCALLERLSVDRDLAADRGGAGAA